MTFSSGFVDAGLLFHDWFVLCLVDLKVACFIFVGGKRSCLNGTPAMQSSLCCLAPQFFVVVGGKRTWPNGMPTFLSIDVPQSSRDFVN